MEEKRMKEVWTECGASRGDGYGSERIDCLLRTDRRTALMRLENRYRRFACMSSGMAVISTLYFFSNRMFGDKAWMIALALMVYFTFGAVVDWTLCNRVESIDVLRLPTAEVICRARACRRLHLQSMCVMLPMAVALIAFFIWTQSGIPEVVWSIITGAAVGIMIGGIMLANFLSDYRTISKD